MSNKTISESIRNVNESIRQLERTMLNEYPLLKVLPQLRDNKGRLRVLICMSYMAIAHGIILLTALFIQFLIGP